MINIDLIEIDVADSGHITNTYIIYDEKNVAIVIDPADKAEKILNVITNKKLNLKYAIITHAHGDHIGALEKLQKECNCKILINECDKESLLGISENYCEMLGVNQQVLDKNNILSIKDGDIIKCSDMLFEIIHTPGHTKGSICIYEKNLNVLFTGDTIFEDCYGRCDLYSGDFESMILSLRKLFKRFNSIQIYPGHGKIVDIESAKKRIRLLIAMKGIEL